MKPSKSLIKARKEWVGKNISCYVRSFSNQRLGPYYGTVVAISDNYATIEFEGGKEYSESGLLVEIPELGKNKTYGVWPVNFSDAVVGDYCNSKEV